MNNFKFVKQFNVMSSVNSNANSHKGVGKYERSLMVIKYSVFDIFITKRFAVYIYQTKVYIPIRGIGNLY